MKNARYEITMGGGSVYSIPLAIIAENRANHYKDKFDGDLQRSLNEDTIPLFESDTYEVEDWAKNNMNWEDVQTHATLIKCGEFDYQEGWVNGETQVVFN